MNLGAPEILLILFVILIFFGAKKIPELAKGLGTGLREFRKAARDIQDDIEKDVKQIDTKKSEEELKKIEEEPKK
jgi:sec-independent protein translocase protein TatA